MVCSNNGKDIELHNACTFLNKTEDTVLNLIKKSIN